MLYVTEGILIEKSEIRDREKSYLVLSRDFGKMRGFYKEALKATPCDIGNIIELSIERKGEVNQIKSCRPKQAFPIGSLKFEAVHKFLLILAFCKRQLPDGGGDGSVYRDLHALIQLSETQDPEHLLFLAECQLLSLWQHWPAKLDNPTLDKVRDLSAHHTLSELTRVKGIPESLRESVHTYFLQSFS